MKATEANFLKFMQGAKQFRIPIFQRTYSWTNEQCKQLWDDIVRVATNDNIPAHFIGSIVYIERGIYQATSITQLLVIDGQQRLTTLSLLLSALGKAIESSKEKIDTTRQKINNYYLFNSEEADEQRYKLILTRSDKELLIQILDDAPLPESDTNRIVENYEFFKEQIGKSELSLNALYLGIAKLVIVDVSLDRSHDNPQLIFESMNSTGLDLSQADLIRNYILMGLESKEQEDLYNTFWFPMEQRFGHAEYSAEFDRFMRDYLTLKSERGTIPNIREVYTDFKKFVQTQTDKNVRGIVSDIYHYSKYFVNLAFLREQDAEITRILSDINTLRVDVAYPFLMEVYNDFEVEKLGRDEFIAILKTVENYVFRRAICGIPTNSLNKTFATLTRNKHFDKSRYLESVQAAFLSKDSYRRFPGDEEFKREIQAKDVYNFRTRNYLLRKLENFSHDKEPITVETYTIEHIMPQNPNLSPEWQKDLESDWKQIQTKYLHTLGNLTLTGYNSEYQDKSFHEKRDMEHGFRDSPIGLNESLKILEHWNETEIQGRAKLLAERAAKIWTVPAMPPAVLTQWSKSDDEEPDDENGGIRVQFDAGQLALFQVLRKHILNLDSSIREKSKKLYVAYKAPTNFVDVMPRGGGEGLRMFLNMPFKSINDPKRLCVDVTGKGHWGNGDVKVYFTSPDQIEDVMFLIKQSFVFNREDTSE